MQILGEICKKDNNDMEILGDFRRWAPWNSAIAVQFSACARSRTLTLSKLANSNHSPNGGLQLD